MWRNYLFFYDDFECENVGWLFSYIEGVEVHCTTHAWKKNWRCNLKCTNGYETPWSNPRRPIKCKAKNHPDMANMIGYTYDPTKPTTYKWQPERISSNSIEAGALCGQQKMCENIHWEYDVSNKLLSWKETQSSLVTYQGFNKQQFRFDFTWVL